VHPKARADDSGGRNRTVICGAAGRDFHNFNVVYRDDPGVEVVAFTAQQIPGMSGRRFPAALAGELYPEGIPIVPEEDLETLCRTKGVGTVVMAYSDTTHADVMHLGSRALAAGADFTMLGPDRTMLRSRRPVVAVSAVRTGCGKSQTARWLLQRFSSRGLRAAALRHPMPYGDLATQRVQRFASRADLEEARCTNEEREEYEPYLEAGGVVFAGIDYAAILEKAEAEADVILWDGGNNDFPFLRPDLHLVVVDALRPDQIASHHPGEAVARMADVFVVNKVDAAAPADVQRAIDAARAINPRADLVRTASPLELETPERVRGRRVLVVDDGPTLTHGGMAYGAGYVAAVGADPKEIVDPRESAAGAIREVYARHPHLGRVLPAVGYGEAQLADLAETIAASRAEVVVSGTPLDLAARIDVPQPVVRVGYRLAEVDEPGLGARVDAFAAERLG
jgi:predicted GTPase